MWFWFWGLCWMPLFQLPPLEIQVTNQCLVSDGVFCIVVGRMAKYCQRYNRPKNECLCQNVDKETTTKQLKISKLTLWCDQIIPFFPTLPTIRCQAVAELSPTLSSTQTWTLATRFELSSSTASVTLIDFNNTSESVNSREDIVRQCMMGLGSDKKNWKRTLYLHPMTTSLSSLSEQYIS